MKRMIGIWDVQAWVTGTALDGFTKEEWWARPLDANPAIWILGHMVSSRRHLARELGFPVEEVARDEHFGMNTKPEDLPKDLDGAGMLADFKALHETFRANLEGMSDEELDLPSDSEFPSQPKTRLGALQFMLMHEAYHVGQLGRIRVQLGKGSWMPGA